MVEARHLPADTRAELAAHYLADPAMLEPTGVLAKFIFRVSLPRIKTAQAQIDTSGSELERAWARATDGDTAAFIRNHAMQMLREIDRITHP
jgi:hypothetical protein